LFIERVSISFCRCIFSRIKLVARPRPPYDPLSEKLGTPFESPSRHVIFDSMTTPRLTFEMVGSEFSTELSLAAFALSAPGAARRSIIVV